jgi:DNA-binding transcriptional LysR family regulator
MGLNMNMKEIESLVTVYKSMSFCEAAYKLNYSPSAISKYVSSVEDELGVALFIRGNRSSSASLTKEGETLMPQFISMYDCYQRLQSDAAAMQRVSSNLLRIGTGIQLSSLGMNEIMADFLQKHPEIRIEQSKYNIEQLIHLLFSGQLDGSFVLVQEGSQNAKTLKSVLDDPKIEAFSLIKTYDMYLGISESEPLAVKDEAPLADFRDFSITFESNHEILNKAGTMEPFKQLSQKSGFELRPLFIEPRDASAYYLATRMKIAIPSLGSSFRYAGIKFIRVSDWDSYAISYFLTLRTNESRALAHFKKSVSAYVKKDRLSKHELP